MKTARFWTRAEAVATYRDGTQFTTSARGWSDDSLEAARDCAVQIAKRVAERIAARRESAGQRYMYGDRPLPEPVTHEFQDVEGERLAIVTRNSYGSLVLNAAHMMFVDIDRKADDGGGIGGLIGSIFGKPKPAQSNPVLDAIENVVQQHGLAARVYETAGGHRAIVTSTAFDAGSPQAEALLADFQSDPLYIRLCRSQECFRARLTPKPWRMDFPSPPATFPFESDEEESRNSAWQADYDKTTASYATCRFITAIGSQTDSGFSELIAYHDGMTKATSGLRLA